MVHFKFIAYVTHSVMVPMAIWPLLEVAIVCLYCDAFLEGRLCEVRAAAATLLRVCHVHRLEPDKRYELKY